MAVTYILKGNTARYRVDEVKVEPDFLRGDERVVPTKLVAAWQTTPDISGRIPPPKYNRDEITHHQNGQYVLLLIDGDYRDDWPGKHAFSGGYGKTTDVKVLVVPTQAAADKLKTSKDTEGGGLERLMVVDGRRILPLHIIAKTLNTAEYSDVGPSGAGEPEPWPFYTDRGTRQKKLI